MFSLHSSFHKFISFVATIYCKLIVRKSGQKWVAIMGEWCVVPSSRAFSIYLDGNRVLVLERHHWGSDTLRLASCKGGGATKLAVHALKLWNWMTSIHCSQSKLPWPLLPWIFSTCPSAAAEFEATSPISFSFLNKILVCAFIIFVNKWNGLKWIFCGNPRLSICFYYYC